MLDKIHGVAYDKSKKKELGKGRQKRGFIAKKSREKENRV